MPTWYFEAIFHMVSPFTTVWERLAAWAGVRRTPVRAAVRSRVRNGFISTSLVGGAEREKRAPENRGPPWKTQQPRPKHWQSICSRALQSKLLKQNMNVASFVDFPCKDGTIVTIL